VIGPPVGAALLIPPGGDLWSEAGRFAALAAFSVLVLPGVMGARLKWVERPFGLDVLLRFHRGRGLPEEEHHFTISSPPEERGEVASTIQAAGDFTETLGRTRPGDPVSVHGVFGRFSHRLRPGERDLVFVAGGIGITPLMAMLRSVRAAGEDRRVRLLSAKRDESAIVLREELAEIERAEAPRLEVVHVLEKPPGSREGETGLVDRDLLHRTAGTAADAWYVCGPIPMRKGAVGAPREMGVPDRRIRIEIFSLVDRRRGRMRTKLLSRATALVTAVVVLAVAGPPGGARLFREKGCVQCHHPDRRAEKTGPGLLGLLSRETLPASGRPATRENVRRQLLDPLSGMPSCEGRLTGEEIESLLRYLESL